MEAGKYPKVTPRPYRQENDESVCCFLKSSSSYDDENNSGYSHQTKESDEPTSDPIPDQFPPLLRRETESGFDDRNYLVG